MDTPLRVDLTSNTSRLPISSLHIGILHVVWLLAHVCAARGTLWVWRMSEAHRRGNMDR